MGKLNIAHHKSYHPYRRDNIERVRQDEEAARQHDVIEEGRMLLADSEARIDLLRRRAGLNDSNAKRRRQVDGEADEDVEREGASIGASHNQNAEIATITSSSGHINLFEDIERQAIPVRSTKRGPPPESENDKGIALAPTIKDLNPWYSTAAQGPQGAREPEKDDKRNRDLARKSAHDPLTSINSQLASSSSSSSSTTPGSRPSRHDSHPQSQSRFRSQSQSYAHAPSSRVGEGEDLDPEVAARVSRESAERQRALELIRRKKREMGGSETPGSVRGDGDGYADVFNRRELEDVRRAKRRDWGRDRERDWERGGGLQGGDAQRAEDWGRERVRERAGGRDRYGESSRR